MVRVSGVQSAGAGGVDRGSGTKSRGAGAADGAVLRSLWLNGIKGCLSGRQVGSGHACWCAEDDDMMHERYLGK